jgi:ubiquinone/menaquinone biosynthesis C-methylase UbiE
MNEPSPQLFFETANAYQRPAALKAALELELFTKIGAGQPKRADEIATACNASPRGVRILCDYLTILGFLTKTDDRYSLTADTAKFLDKNSQAYVGGALGFLHSPTLMHGFDNLTEVVRRGTTMLPDKGTVGEDHSIWVNFAKAMAPLQFGIAQQLADLILRETPALRERDVNVLDVAAGHGLFGIALAQRLPKAKIVSQDFGAVLDVANENSKRFNVSDRFERLPGDAFEIDLGEGRFDLVLLTNILHHFDQPTCVKLLRKVHRALRRDGQAVTVEFVPDENRVTPPMAASFSLMMLAGTPAGDAYTFSQLDRMFRDAGFGASKLHPQQIGPHRALISPRAS